MPRLRTFFFFLAVVSQLFSTTPGQRRSLLNSLDPTSFSQHLAFYELYGETGEGGEALKRIWKTISPHSRPQQGSPPLPFSCFLQAGTPLAADHQPTLSQQEIETIKKLGQHLKNRELQGYGITDETLLLQLPPEEIDLARAVLLTQGGDSIESYEAILDLMALQVLARLPANATPIEKIDTVNHLLFNEMQVRFPPHSLYAKEIDQYTFLPSVLDKREGVCLGVTIMYLAIAQRIGLPLEAVTPPGHIYLRYATPTYHINIETTARGIHLDDDLYLGVNVRSLQQRSLREVVGMVHYNEASVHWQRDDHEKVKECYRKAYRYLPDDPHLQELMALNAIVRGKREEGKKLLAIATQAPPKYLVSRDPLARDILDYNLDDKAVEAVMMSTDQRRPSLLKKKEALEQVIERYPQARSPHFHLAVTYLQLHRSGEALKLLGRYHALDKNNPQAEFYLALLSAERRNYPKAWDYLQRAEMITGIRGHYPKRLHHFHRQLATIAPKRGTRQN